MNKKINIQIKNTREKETKLNIDYINQSIKTMTKNYRLSN